MVSFAEGHELLPELGGVDVPTTHVERAAEARGREVAVDEPAAPTLYLGMAGTGVPMRKSELVGRDDAVHARTRRGVGHLLGRHRERGHA